MEFYAAECYQLQILLLELLNFTSNLRISDGLTKVWMAACHSEFKQVNDFLCLMQPNNML